MSTLVRGAVPSAASRIALATLRMERMRNRRVAFYHVYTAFTLGVAAVVLIPVNPRVGEADNGLFVGAWVAMQLLAIALFFTLRGGRFNSLLIGLGIGVYIVGSAAWSASPQDSILYGGMVACNIVVAYMVAVDMSLEQILRMFARVVGALVVGGMLAVLAGYQPALYQDIHGRPGVLGVPPIRGFFSHKIMGALFASLGVIFVLYSHRGWRRVGWVVILLIFVLLTGSATGLVLLPASVGLWVFFSIVRAWRVPVVVVLLYSGTIICVAGAFILPNYVEVVEYFGRDASLTGRTLLWDWGMQTWQSRPLLGWGFNGYLNGPNAQAINQAYVQMNGYEVPHFHQSFIQTGVDLGLIGVGLLVGIIFSVVIRGVRLFRSDRGAEGVAVVSTVLTLLVASLVMFLFFTYNHFGTFALFVMYFGLREPARMAEE